MYFMYWVNKKERMARGGARGSFWGLFGVVLCSILKYSGVFLGILWKTGSDPEQRIDRGGAIGSCWVFLGSNLEYFRVFWGKLAPPLPHGQW